MRKNLIVVAIAVLCATLVACKAKNPVTGPTPTTCQDPKATNVGGPLPCTHPVVSVIHIEEVSPPSGSTIPYNSSGPQFARITVSFVFDPMIPGTVGVETALSADCSTIIPLSSSITTGLGTSGAFTQSLPGLALSTGFKQIACVVARVVVVERNCPSSPAFCFPTVTSVVAEEWKPWVLKYQ